MTKEQFNREKSYRISLSLAKTMLAQSLITKAEYTKIDTMLLDKYQPILGGLCR
ncbi:MAG: SHOCT domain-containing protein [Saccharofermentanales bacterium]